MFRLFTTQGRVIKTNSRQTGCCIRRKPDSRVRRNALRREHTLLCQTDAMKRKMKLICRILVHVECHLVSGLIPVPEFDGYSDSEIHYHVGLCEQAGYLVTGGAGVYDGEKQYSGLGSLTWTGHEALSELRQNGNGI